MNIKPISSQIPSWLRPASTTGAANTSPVNLETTQDGAPISPLATSLSQLQQLALADERLVVPPAGQAAFLSRYYPRLRRMAPVISSDGSFTPPRISEPRLVLSARYSGAHDMDLRWEWAYQVGDAGLRAAVGSRPAEFRDPAAEARVLAGVDLPERARFSAVTLHGLDTMVFSTEVLPLLSDRDDVRVEVSGRVPDYREAGESLRIGVSAAELDGEQDWFDLGITVTVEGREVPFAELFVALASGQSRFSKNSSDSTRPIMS